MPDPKPYYQKLPDGTLKHRHPIYGTEVWTVPDRSSRPFRKTFLTPQPIKNTNPENYCDFCQANYFKTPPEKTRLIQTSDNGHRIVGPLSAEQLGQSKALFRRVTNLFEIVPLNYWIKNHGFHMSPEQVQWQKAYLSHPLGMKHILEVIDTKLRLTGKTAEQISAIPNEEKLHLADAFFGGDHELIIAAQHFKAGAQFDNELVSAGELTPRDHAWYFLFTIDALKDIYTGNPYIRYVMVFQNWLHAAGASVEHLHRQLVGMDSYGPALEQALQAAQDDPSIYNGSIIDFSIQEGLIVAENEHAIGIAEIGHQFPTLAVYSKSRARRPEDHTPEEITGVSDMVHAFHAASGNQVPCNEEWYYTPRDSKNPIPWHILIKWRTNNLAGFEGGTKIYLNPLTPADLKDRIVPKLKELRDLDKIAKISIGNECRPKPGPLLYGQR